MEPQRLLEKKNLLKLTNDGLSLQGRLNYGAECMVMFLLLPLYLPLLSRQRARIACLTCTC